MPIDFDALGRDGLLLADGMGDTLEPENCAWALLKDAARAIESSGYGAGGGKDGPWGMITMSHWEIFGLEREWETDGIKYESRRPRYQPDARSIMRSAWMQELMMPSRHRNIGKDPRLALKAVWIYAHGARPAKVKEMTGVGRTSLHRFKQKCCQNIAAVVYRNVIAA